MEYNFYKMKQKMILDNKTKKITIKELSKKF